MRSVGNGRGIGYPYGFISGGLRSHHTSQGALPTLAPHPDKRHTARAAPGAHQVQGDDGSCLVYELLPQSLYRKPLHAEYVRHENPHWHYFTLQYRGGVTPHTGFSKVKGSELQVSSRARWRLCDVLIERVVSGPAGAAHRARALISRPGAAV